MTKNRSLIIPAVVIGTLLIAVAIVYWVSTASDLPSFFPGHTSTGSEAGTHHVKHGIATFLLGLACYVFAWFQTGPASRGGSDAPRDGSAGGGSAGAGSAGGGPAAS